MAICETQKQPFNLARLHRECEANYRRLQRLVADSQRLGASVSLQQPDQSCIDLKVIEVTKFTSTISLVLGRAELNWLAEIDIKVRIYHDAKMAEVIEWCTDRTIPWQLVEKNGKQSTDEKWQWNLFLSELLAQGLHHQAMATEGQ